MIGVYRKTSGGEKVPLNETGFLYTPRHCGEIMAYNTFYNAIKQIVDRGFFEVPPHLQGYKVAQARPFLPSRKWVSWTSPAAVAELKSKRAAVERKCKRDSARRARFLCANANPESRAA